jgi:uncharacterized membrane protein YfcA
MTAQPYTLPVLAIVFLSTLVRSAFGFGNAMIAMPLLALVIPIEVAAPLVAFVSTIIAGLVVASDWRHIHLTSAGWLAAFCLAGTPLGILFLRLADEHALKATLAIIILGFSVYSLARPRPPQLKDDRSAWLFGLCSGVLGGAYNVNGPPLVIYGTLRRWPAERFRATLQGFFLPVSLFTFCAQGVAGLWTPPVLWYSAASLPVVILAVYLGRIANRLLPDERFQTVVHALLVLTAVLLLLQLRHA